jgi:hypothetical protein
VEVACCRLLATIFPQPVDEDEDWVVVVVGESSAAGFLGVFLFLSSIRPVVVVVVRRCICRAVAIICLFIDESWMLTTVTKGVDDEELLKKLKVVGDSDNFLNFLNFEQMTSQN